MTGEQLESECRRAGLSWSQACWLAEVPEVEPHAISAADGLLIAERLNGATPGFMIGVRGEQPHHGLCPLLEQTADERAWQWEAERLEVRRMALWNTAARLTQRKTGGPSLLDEDAVDVDPKSVIRQAWSTWKSLNADTSPYELAWCVGACRLLGLRVESDNGKTNIRLGSNRADDVGPMLAVLRKHRTSVVERLAIGTFDSVEWQVALLTKFAGEWCVWGGRIGGVPIDKHRSSVLPILLTYIPPFYDVATVYRPDAWRSIPKEAMAVVRGEPTVGRWLSAGWVYLGPATVDYPDGKGAVVAAEIKIRKAKGFTVNRVNL